MAPLIAQGVASVYSTHVLSPDRKSIVVEPGSLTPVRWFLERGQRPGAHDDEPPTKRQKTNGDNTGVVAFTELPESDDILLSHVTVDLHFSDTLVTKPAKAETIERDVSVDTASSILVEPVSVDQPSEGSSRITLRLRSRKSPILVIECGGLSPNELDALQSLVVSRSDQAKRVPSKHTKHPATRYRWTLSRSDGVLYNVIRLEASLLWRSGASAFPAGAPVGKARFYPDYDTLLKHFPDVAREEVDHTKPWTPRDFYDSVHVPRPAPANEADLDGVLESRLFPFQRRAVHWMLEREGQTFDGQVLSATQNTERSPDLSFLTSFRDSEGRECFVNHLQGVIQRSQSGTSRLSGGLLAEEMGLGKTVEVIALLSLHRRSPDNLGKTVDARMNRPVLRSRATLIVTPLSILQQWKTELARHAPALSVMQYEGLRSKHAKREAELLDDLANKYDVVLTTYQTLTREVHIAEDPPERNMRHAQRFERKRSPLMQIEWWRICLDEAQMIESGVTAAARVACRLPRIHSWAVSGTPLRKNAQDLHGLLIFLRCTPLSDDAKLWSHLITNHRHLFRMIFGQIALRHTKAQIREELHLPPQKRVVITVPFTAIEQQHYATLFSQMCEDVGVHDDGSPIDGQWDPGSSDIVGHMREWLVRLRQTCLHPQVGGRNRRALGRSQGPLRTVAEVLEVMIDLNETQLRTEERAVLASQLLRAHIQGNARDDEHRSEKALEIYLDAMHTSVRLTEDARKRLATAKQVQAEKGETIVDTEDEDDSSTESSPLLGRLRNTLRAAIQLQHACTFYAATSYFQIKTNEALTTPDSDHFRELEEKEVSLYESAKLLRREVLKENARKSESFMRKIRDLQSNQAFTAMPEVVALDELGGFENRRITEKSDRLFEVLREQSAIIHEWRTKMGEYLLRRLVDEDEGIETTGDEYEDSTKLQDELYVYFDAVKAMQADMSNFVTNEDAPLIDHEVKISIYNAKKFLDPETPDELKPQQVHAPVLTLELLGRRNQFRQRKDEIGSIRGLIAEARAMETSLQWQEGGARVAERAIIQRHMQALQKAMTAYTKALAGLDKEVDLFRATQNQRLEFYKQLQELSDSVKPYKEELDETLDLKATEVITAKEEQQAKSLAQLKTKNRFLLHLREESNAQDAQRICVICQMQFETGVLTVCGHQFCKECINHWWVEHKTCPVCKRRLAAVDFHNITYKPHELRAQEEVPSGSTSLSDESTSASRQSSIYSDVDTHLLQEIKSIDLPSSYGTKIDTLGRHIRWIREHDPGAKSIVFSQYREFLDILGTALRDFKIGYARLGSANAVEKFKNDPNIDCLLLDAKTDSSGLTLVNATHAFICEPLIQTAVELQAIARIHRIGQTRPTTVWMYLINDTVEEAIYEISVSRRLAHVQARQPSKAQKSRSATPLPLQESAIDAANSAEMQSAPISKLLVATKGGGELVGNDDLWQCLFGKAQKSAAKPSVEMQREVDRHLGAEAAETRRVVAVAT